MNSASITITKEDIHYAEEKLLPTEKSFDNERCAFIKCLDSCDVIACPGSGKTTALLAKLMVLSKKMPFSNGGGVCVLTHTNVAIDEIKKKLGVEANSLLSYPNFFGTIQSFVDRFLAMPCYRKEFGHNLVSIDTDKYLDRLVRQCHKNNAGWWLEQQRSKKNPELTDVVNKIILGEDLKIDLSAFSKLKDPTKPTYKKLVTSAKDVLEAGYISYDQAFTLANYYLKKHPTIQKVFAKRFKFVLIDEMQDTNEKQLALLQSVLPKDLTVVQRVGDPNQAIFNNAKGGDMKWSPPKEALSFSSSMRYGNTIATILAPIRIDANVPLTGNPDVLSLPPYILTYDENNKTNIVEAFGSLVQQVELPIEGHTYKAIGWVKSDSEAGRTCIPHYCPSYKPPQKVTHDLASFVSYLKLYEALSYCDHSPKKFSELTWAGLWAYGKRCNFNVAPSPTKTTTSFKKWIKEHYPTFFTELSELMAESLTSFTISGDIQATAKQFSQYLSNTNSWPDKMTQTRSAKTFLESTLVDDKCLLDENSNSFTCSEGPLISIGTVHSVKGETHTGTLLLETKYQRKHESEYLIEYLKGNVPKGPKGVHLKSCIKVVHVAMSRPTHLFVLACSKDRINGHEAALRENNWEIVSVEDLLSKDSK